MTPDARPAHDRPATPTREQASPLQSAVLEVMSGADNYISWLASLAEPHLGDTPLEIGAGIGDYAEIWSRGRSLTASEADPARLAVLQQRFGGRSDVTVRALEVPITETASHSSVVAYNVLEHIEDQVGALRSFAGLVRPGGRVVLIVPAFMIAMSDFDREIGHYRRYRKKDVVAAMTAAGLVPVDVRYVNPVGLVGWIVLMRLLGKRTDDTPVAFFDRRVVPVLRRVERHVRPPFGQSVLAVAEVPARA